MNQRHRPVAPQRRSLFETFEERLALSAQPLWDARLPDGGRLQQHVEELPSGLEASHGDFSLERLDDLPGQSDQLHPFLHDAFGSAGLNYIRDAYGFDGSGQTVVIIDSGIAYDHVALGGGFGTGYQVVGGWDFAENDADPYDDGPAGFHGTHVAGIVGSTDATYRGVAPGVDLVALRVFDDNGAGYFHWTEQALQWVHAHRNDFANPITTVNLSLGASWNGDTPPSWAMLEDEFAQLKADGIFISVSAGNSFTSYNRAGLSYPAASQYVVPVASVDNNGSLSYFSQRNSRVIAAPGRSVTSTVPDYALGADGVKNDFAAASGTSMAAPYVAGAAALVREAMEFVGYVGINQDTIYEHMRSTADLIYDTVTGANYHRLNLQRAIESLMPADDYGSTADTAHDLGVLSTPQTLTGTIHRVDDVDCFTFTAGVTGTAVFRVAPEHGLTLSATNIETASECREGELRLSVASGGTYTVALASVAGTGDYEILAEIEGTAPTAPSNFRAEVISASQVRLTWEDSAGEDDYWVYQWLNGQSTYLDGVARDGTSYVVNVTPGDVHHFYLVAHNATGITGSGWISVTTTPSAPGHFSATPVSASEVELSWEDSTGETEYWIYQYRNGRSEYITGIAANSTTFRVSGLAAGELHHFYVVAHNPAGNTGSGWQGSYTLTTAPTSLTVAAVSSSSVQLSWGDAAAESQYWIYTYRNGASEYLFSVAANTTSCLVDNLAANQTHHFYVVAVNADGIAGSGWQSIDLCAPSNPGPLSAAVISSTQVQLQWSDSEHASEYRIYQWLNGRSTYLDKVAPGQTTYQINNLIPGTLQHFYVVAHNAVGQAGSGWIAVTVNPHPFHALADESTSLGVEKLAWWRSQSAILHNDSIIDCHHDTAPSATYDSNAGEHHHGMCATSDDSFTVDWWRVRDVALIEESDALQRVSVEHRQSKREMDAVDEVFETERFAKIQVQWEDFGRTPLADGS